MSRSRRSAASAALLLLLLLLLAGVMLGGPAWADGGPRQIGAGTDQGGATVDVIDGPAGVGGAGSGCGRRYVPFTSPANTATIDPIFFGLPPSPLHVLYNVYDCNGAYITSIWAVPQSASAVFAAQAARELLAHVPFPPVTIQASPARGLTGLDSWFWIDGTDGAPITLARSDFGITIELEVRLTGVDWDFADGPSVHAGLGAAFPKRSPVTHVFERKGTRTVRAAFRFDARYRVDGGPWIELGPVPRTAGRTYDVVEVRGLLVR